jgi:hypothetical protein
MEASGYFKMLVTIYHLYGVTYQKPTLLEFSVVMEFKSSPYCLHQIVEPPSSRFTPVKIHTASTSLMPE